MMRRGFCGSLLVAGILTLLAASASAQAIGSIFGKVTDESGAVLPGVTVTVAGPSLQQPLIAVTTATGAYQFPSVPIGKYTVTFEMSGFKKVTRPDVVIESGFNAGIDQKLDLGALTDEVTVSGSIADRRLEENDHRVGLQRRCPREDPLRPRPVADHRHDAGRPRRSQRRRFRVRAAGRA